MDSKDNVIDTTLPRESKLGGQSQTSNQNAADLGKFIPGQLPLVSVKEEPSETVSSGTDFTKGHHAIVVAAQSAGHGQIDHSVRPLQIVEPANESSDILAPSGNREFWKSWSTDIPTSSAKGNILRGSGMQQRYI